VLSCPLKTLDKCVFLSLKKLLNWLFIGRHLRSHLSEVGHMRPNRSYIRQMCSETNVSYNALCNNALWGQTHFWVQPQSAVNFTAYFGVKRILGSKLRNWPQRALICYISTPFGYQSSEGVKWVLLKYWLIFDLRHWNIWGGVQDDGRYLYTSIFLSVI
jgi:hypothetical protein